MLEEYDAAGDADEIYVSSTFDEVLYTGGSITTGKTRDSSSIHPASAVTVSIYVPFSPEEMS